MEKRGLAARVFFPVLAILPAAMAFCQSADDSLFADSPGLVQAPPSAVTSDLGAGFEASKGVVLGGSITYELDTTTEGVLTQSLGLRLTADARPDPTLRVYASSAYGYDFSGGTGNFVMEELFADLVWDRTMSLRAGKQLARWGRGYWWSPADILSLEPIDVADPEASREGTVAAKLTLPVGEGGLSLYAVPDGTDTAAIGWAGQFEAVLGSTELSLGGYYRQDGAFKPRLVFTASFPVTAVDFYAEAVCALGSERAIVDFSTKPSPTLSYSSAAAFQGAFGFLWKDDDPRHRWNSTLTAEYYFNGLGSADASSYPANRAALSLLVASGLLPASSLSGYGRHYAAASLDAEELWASRFGLILSWYANLSDASGVAQGSLSWQASPNLAARLGYKAVYGPTFAEFALNGSQGLLVLSLGLWKNTEVELDVPLSGDTAASSLAITFVDASF